MVIMLYVKSHSYKALDIHHRISNNIIFLTRYDMVCKERVCINSDSSNMSFATSAFNVNAKFFSLSALNFVCTVNSSYSFLTWLLSGHNLQNVSRKKDSTHKSKVLISRKLIILWRYSSVSIARTMWCHLSKQWMLFYKYGRNYSLSNTVFFFS